MRDTTPPVLTLPGNITVNATSPSGAIVVYTASATDLVSGAVTVACSPASGSTFPIGITPVSCSAKDSSDNLVTSGFSVGVLGAAQITADLLAQVTIDNFQQASNLLQNVLNSISSGNTGAACNQLGAFINQVQAQSGKKLTTAEATALIGFAASAKTALGCP